MANANSDEMQGTEASPFSSFVNSIKNTFRPEPRSIEVIRFGLDEPETRDIDFINLLSQHHDFMKESISILMDKTANPADKREHLTRFLKLLYMHGHAEEETLYTALKITPQKPARLEALSGQDEHKLAYQLGRELELLNFKYIWNEDIEAKANVLASLVLNHIKEEESQMFPLASADIDEARLEAMTPEYIRKCKIYLNEDFSQAFEI